MVVEDISFFLRAVVCVSIVHHLSHSRGPCGLYHLRLLHPVSWEEKTKVEVSFLTVLNRTPKFSSFPVFEQFLHSWLFFSRTLVSIYLFFVLLRINLCATPNRQSSKSKQEKIRSGQKSCCVSINERQCLPRPIMLHNAVLWSRSWTMQKAYTGGMKGCQVPHMLRE